MSPYALPAAQTGTRLHALHSRKSHKCFVAASYFAAGLRSTVFGGLACASSPKAPHYVWLVVVPLFRVAPTAEAYYDCRGLPTTLFRTSATWTWISRAGTRTTGTFGGMSDNPDNSHDPKRYERVILRLTPSNLDAF